MFGIRRPLIVAALAVCVGLGSLVLSPGHAVASDALSSTDALWTRNALKAAEISRWVTASKFAKRIKHPLAAKLLTWRRLTAGANNTTFSEIDSFLKANPDWPYQRRLLRHAERLMPFTMTPEETFIWFANREPASAEGAMRLGAAGYVSKPADADEVLAAFERGDRAPLTAHETKARQRTAPAPSLARAEWEHINRVLGDCGGNISEAARRLGLHRRSLQRKLQKYPPRS